MFFRLSYWSLFLLSCLGAISNANANDFAGTIEKPKDKEWGELYLVEIELPKSRPHPSEYYCEGADDPESICLGASIIYRKGTLLRTLASTDGKSLRGNKVSVKGIGRHAIRFAPAKYVVALLELTEDGYFWIPIQEDIEKSCFCLDNHAIEYFSINLKLKPRKSEAWNSCFRI